MQFTDEARAAKFERIKKFYGDVAQNRIANTIKSKLLELDEILSAYGQDPSKLDRVDKLNMIASNKGSSMSDAERAAINLITNKEGALDGLSQEEIQEAKRANAILSAEESSKEIDPEINRRLNSTSSGLGSDSRLARTFDRRMAGEDLSDSYDGARYKKISKFIKDDLKNLYENNRIFKNSIYATGALVAGSLAYSGVRDRSPESVGGPPLLPGGSAYERYPQRQPQIPENNYGTVGLGTSYKINLNGNRSMIEKFSQVAGQFGNFNTDTTMYSGIPEVGRDPYQELASSY